MHPPNHQGVVTPQYQVFAREGCQTFKSKEMEEESCCLQVIYCDGSQWIGVLEEETTDVLGPFQVPHCGQEVFEEREPDSTGSLK